MCMWVKWRFLLLKGSLILALVGGGFFSCAQQLDLNSSIYQPAGESGSTDNTEEGSTQVTVTVQPEEGSEITDSDLQFILNFSATPAGGTTDTSSFSLSGDGVGSLTVDKVDDQGDGLLILDLTGLPGQGTLTLDFSGLTLEEGSSFETSSLDFTANGSYSADGSGADGGTGDTGTGATGGTIGQ